MIELNNNQLIISFPDVHPEASARIDFQRTLRLPDDGKKYPLPPGLGRFPLFHVEDFAERLPPSWLPRGGIMLPMYQAEALWINFSARYPMAVKIATGKINVINGKGWRDGLDFRHQNYVVASEQPWLDGYCVKKGTIRQFVAMPLGSGYSAEEQLTGQSAFGGLQIEVFPLKRTKWESMQALSDIHFRSCELRVCEESPAMGFAPGGRMKQKIEKDPYEPEDWEMNHSSRCFVQICNSLVWQSLSGQNPPHPPPTAEAYTRSGLPWFAIYSEAPALKGSKRLQKLLSVAQKGQHQELFPLPENKSTSPQNILQVSKKKFKSMS